MGAVAAIKAAAERILTRKGGKTVAPNGDGSQALAWDFYRTVPEVGAYADWISNAMTGAQLFAGKIGPDGTVVPGDPKSRAAQLVASIAGGPSGQSDYLGEYGTQLTVAGEGWTVIVPDPGDNRAKDRWLVLSTKEVSVSRGKVKFRIDGVDLDVPEFDPDVPESPENPAYFRIWKPAPDEHERATSPVIRSQVILEELRLLNAAVAAIARSRITGRGVLLVPAGTRFPVQPGQDQAEDSLLDTFIEVASTAIREPESAAATVPIVLEVPGDLISGVQWLQFDSQFDAMALQLRDEAIRRFATGADVPAEILMGLGDASHWGAWAITAEALRMGAEPRLGLVCNGLTTMWLRPILESEGVSDADEWMVWYDTSGLRSSSNKGASALDAYDKGLINGKAARRELGFTEADAPGAEGDTGPAPATTEGTDLPVEETQAPPAEPTPTDQARAVASVAVLDSFTAGTDAALAEAVDGLVWGALAVAGRKLQLTPAVPRPKRGEARMLAADAVHTQYPARSDDDVHAYGLLNGAWTRVPAVAARYGLDDLRLAAALDSYLVSLLTSGEPHTFDNTTRLLAQIRVSAVAA